MPKTDSISGPVTNNLHLHLDLRPSDNISAPAGIPLGQDELAGVLKQNNEQLMRAVQAALPAMLNDAVSRRKIRR